MIEIAGNETDIENDICLSRAIKILIVGFAISMSKANVKETGIQIFTLFSLNDVICISVLWIPYVETNGNETHLNMRYRQLQYDFDNEIELNFD